MPSKPNILARVPASVRRRVIRAFMGGRAPDTLWGVTYRPLRTDEDDPAAVLTVPQVHEIIRRLARSGRW